MRYFHDYKATDKKKRLFAVIRCSCPSSKAHNTDNLFLVPAPGFLTSLSSLEAILPQVSPNSNYFIRILITTPKHSWKYPGERAAISFQGYTPICVILHKIWLDHHDNKVQGVLGIKILPERRWNFMRRMVRGCVRIHLQLKVLQNFFMITNLRSEANQINYFRNRIRSNRSKLHWINYYL